MGRGFGFASAARRLIELVDADGAASVGVERVEQLVHLLGAGLGSAWAWAWAER